MVLHRVALYCAVRWFLWLSSLSLQPLLQCSTGCICVISINPIFLDWVKYLYWQTSQVAGDIQQTAFLTVLYLLCFCQSFHVLSSLSVHKVILLPKSGGSKAPPSVCLKSGYEAFVVFILYRGSSRSAWSHLGYGWIDRGMLYRGKWNCALTGVWYLIRDKVPVSELLTQTDTVMSSFLCYCYSPCMILPNCSDSALVTRHFSSETQLNSVIIII